MRNLSLSALVLGACAAACGNPGDDAAGPDAGVDDDAEVAGDGNQPDADAGAPDADDSGDPPRNGYTLELQPVPSAGSVGCAHDPLEVYFVFDGSDFWSAFDVLDVELATPTRIELMATWVDDIGDVRTLRLDVDITGEDLVGAGRLHVAHASGVCSYGVSGSGGLGLQQPPPPPPGCFPGVTCPP